MVGDEPGPEDAARRTLRDAALLGYHLTFAQGFRVVDLEGDELGVLDSLRYERHAEFPEEIVVRTGWLRRRRHTIPFARVDSVDTRSQTVKIRSD